MQVRAAESNHGHYIVARSRRLYMSTSCLRDDGGGLELPLFSAAPPGHLEDSNSKYGDYPL